MTDINTLMALMSALGGMKRENGGDVAPRGNAMMNILPIVMSMTGGRQAESGNVNGAERRDILPLILNLMKNGTGTPPSENREEKPAPKDTRLRGSGSAILYGNAVAHTKARLTLAAPLSLSSASHRDAPCALHATTQQKCPANDERFFERIRRRSVSRTTSILRIVPT